MEHSQIRNAIMDSVNTHMTTSQVARQLGISAERVRQLARSGALKPDLVINSCRYWTPETVELFSASRGPWGRFRTVPATLNEHSKEHS